MKLKTSLPRRAGRAQSFLAALLAALFVAHGLPASGVARAQTATAEAPPAPAGKRNFQSLPPDEGRAFVIHDANGHASCREATPAERREILRRDPNVRTSPHLSAPGGGEGEAAASHPSDPIVAHSNIVPPGLNIVFRPTSQLAGNPTAMAAFERAAAQWEAIITSNITVVIDVDFGPTRFGQPFGENVLGSTSNGVFYVPPYAGAKNVRSRLVARASNAAEAGLYNSLPAGPVPTDLGAATQIAVESPIARALGAIEPHANQNAPGGDDDALGRAPAIAFNSNSNFDFNPDDLIGPNQTDFVAVAIHEIGHVLGFTSSVGARDLEPQFGLWPSVWDLFRFRAGAGPGQFATATRVLTPGGDPAQVYFDGGPELLLSTARPDSTGGDGQQASHWKDDQQIGQNNYIGIMDPTIRRGPGQPERMTDNDIRAVNFFGYQVGTPPPPANDNQSNATALATASGSLTASSVGATKEPGPEPNHAGNAGGRSIWFTWTSSGSGLATINTAGSSFDTTLAVYSVNSAGGLNEPCGTCQNDDIGDGGIPGQPHNTDSSVQFQATAGTTYRVAVDGYDGDFGRVVLNWSLPGVATAPSVIQFAQQVYTAQEHDGSVGILVTRAGDTGGQQTVLLQMSGDTARVAGPPAGQVTFAPGETYKSVAVTISDDQTAGPNQVVSLALAPVSPGTQIGALGTAALTVFDDDNFPANSVRIDGAALRVVSEGVGKVDFTVTRGGALAEEAAVSYRTADGTALSTKDYTFSGGTLRFAPGETAKTFSVIITDDAHDDEAETFTVQLLHPRRTSVVAGDNAIVTVQINDNDGPGPSPNPIDTVTSFVDQHYGDFLNRKPDAGGFAFWSNQMTNCSDPPPADLRVCRDNVSAAFYLSIEFQETGYLVYRMYKAAYGNLAGKPVPVRFDEFMVDTQEIGQGVEVGVGDWFSKLEANKSAFQLAFVRRGRFKTALPQGLTPVQFVEALNRNAGNVLSTGEAGDLAARLTADNTDAGRAAVLRQVADHAAFRDAEQNRAFVLMQYFGYLRRNPDDVGFNGQSDPAFEGYHFWLTKLNQFGGNFVNAEMVKAFIESIEYRQRFGQ